jgi:hypothetical protein
MPRWIERRGFTLRVPGTARLRGGAHPGAEAPERFVRLSLMERVGLVSGWFNVREARAEPDAAESMRIVAGGRALSWRWLREPEAERLLEERLGTLEAMGYTVLDSVMAGRGRWDWLYDLVHRRLHRADVEPAPTTTTAAPGDALRDALARLGLSPDAVIEGVASVLGLSPHGFAEPDPRTVRRTDPEQLALLLPFLVHDDRAEIRSIGERWLRQPTVAYQLPPHVLVQWLETDPEIAALLGPRLRDEGLALLGPDRVVRLSRTGQPAVREAARAWSHRLSG